MLLLLPLLLLLLLHRYTLFTPGHLGGWLAPRSVSNVLAKCVCSALVAIPSNAIFIVYATSMEHAVVSYNLSTHDKRQHKHSSNSNTTTNSNSNNNSNNLSLAIHDSHAISSSSSSSNQPHLLHDLQHRFETRFVRVVAASWLMWLPSNFVCWYFIPLQYRMMWSSTAAVAWNCYLSLVQHEETDTEVLIDMHSDDSSNKTPLLLIAAECVEE